MLQRVNKKSIFSLIFRGDQHFVNETNILSDHSLKEAERYRTKNSATPTQTLQTFPSQPRGVGIGFDLPGGISDAKRRTIGRGLCLYKQRRVKILWVRHRSRSEQILGTPSASAQDSMKKNATSVLSACLIHETGVLG
jgi:hypothetical protein